MMKKIKYILLLVFILPMIVLADAAPPTLGQLPAIVSNNEGTVTKEGQKLEYGQKVTLLYGYRENGIMYYAIFIDGDSNRNATIKADDVSQAEYNLEDFNTGHEITKYVYKTTKMYTGPMTYYDEVEEIEIPEGTVLKSKYYSQLYMYVTYNDVSGWVYIYEQTNADYKNGSDLADVFDSDRVLYTAKDVTLKNDPINGVNLDTKIPANTKLDIQYVYTDRNYSQNYYVTYNGVSGWIRFNSDTRDIKQEVDTPIYIVNDKVNVYSSVDDNASVVGTLTKDTQLVSKYTVDLAHGQSYFYVDTDNVSGWLRAPYNNDGTNNINYITSYESEMDFDGDYVVYKSFTTNSEISGNIQLHGKYKTKYLYINDDKTIYYIDDANGMSGWIETDKKVEYIKLKNTSNIYKEVGVEDNPLGIFKENETVPYHNKKTDENGEVWYQVINYRGITGWFADKKIEEVIVNNTNDEPIDVTSKEDLNKLYYLLGAIIILVVLTIVLIIKINKNKKNSRNLSENSDSNNIINNDNIGEDVSEIVKDTNELENGDVIYTNNQFNQQDTNNISSDIPIINLDNYNHDNVDNNGNNN